MKEDNWLDRALKEATQEHLQLPEWARMTPGETYQNAVAFASTPPIEPCELDAAERGE